MKKIFPILMLVIMLSGCNGTVEKVADPLEAANVKAFLSKQSATALTAFNDLTSFTTGYAYVLIAIELNTNASSLFIDKTKEEIVGYDSQVLKKLEPGKFFYIIPPKISNGEVVEYDEEMGRMLRNYITIAKYGIPVSRAEDAEYFVIINVSESLSKSYGLNYSEIAFSIMDKYDLPVYLASIRVESKSDKNFWYYETKKAKPVKQLTMKGLTKILASGLPEVHGQPELLVALAKKREAEKAESGK